MKKKFVRLTIVILLTFVYIRCIDYICHLFYFNKLEESGKANLPKNQNLLKQLDDFIYTIKTNSLGLRGPEISEKVKGNSRILFLGDSFIFGEGLDYEKTFVKITEDYLNQKGYPVETLNAGKIGAGPREYFYIYKNIVKTLKPDSIVIGIYTNDVFDMTEESLLLKAFRGSKKKKFSYQIGYLFIPKTLDFLLKKELLKIASKLQADESSVVAIDPNSPPKLLKREYPSMPDELILYALDTFTQNLELKISKEEIETWKKNVGSDILSRALQGRISVMHVLGGLLYPTYFSQAIDLTEDGKSKYESMVSILKDFRDDCRESNINIYIVYIPSELHYDSKKLALNRRLGYTVREDWLLNTSALESKMEKDLESLGIPFLSLTDEFRKHSQDELVWDFDLHLNENGSKLAAEKISKFLLKQKESKR